MKIVTCDLCNHEVQGENFEQWMENLRPHYVERHAEVISDSTKTKEDMMKWMIENQQRFEEA